MNILAIELICMMICVEEVFFSSFPSASFFLQWIMNNEDFCDIRTAVQRVAPKKRGFKKLLKHYIKQTALYIRISI